MNTLITTCLLLCLAYPASADDAAIKTRLNGIARKVSMRGDSISKMGIMGQMSLRKPVRKEIPGNKFKVAYEWVSDGTVDGVLRSAEGAKTGASVDASGRPYGLRDSTTIIISWSGKAWPIGKIQYQTAQGLLRTCPLWTASEAEAMAFYRKHGFTRAAQDAVMVAD